MHHASALLLALAAGAPQSEKSNVVWRWEPDANSCELRQLVSDTGSLFTISRPPATGQTWINFSDRSNESFSSWEDLKDVSVGVVPGGTLIGSGHLGQGEHGTRAVSVLITDQAFLPQFSSASALVLSHQKIGSVKIPLRASAAAARALRVCEDNNMRKWVIDPVAWRSLRRPPTPVGSISGWLSENDYPITAEIFSVGADVIARLTVGADGTVQKCVGLNRNIFEGFNYSTCDALKRRAKFQPALDEQGRPTSAPFVVNVRFRMAFAH